MAPAGHVTVYCDGCHDDIQVPVETTSTDQPAAITLRVDHAWLAAHIDSHTTAA